MRGFGSFRQLKSKCQFDGVGCLELELAIVCLAEGSCFAEIGGGNSIETFQRQDQVVSLVSTSTVSLHGFKTLQRTQRTAIPSTPVEHG